MQLVTKDDLAHHPLGCKTATAMYRRITIVMKTVSAKLVDNAGYMELA